MTERKRKFADAYLRLANATRAAIEAGYSAKTAQSSGPRLLGDVEVMALVESKLIRREVHAQVTYQNMIALADMAMEHCNELKALPRGAIELQDFHRAIAVARASLETLGKVEGLFIDRMEHSGPGGVPLPSTATTINVAVLNTPERMREVLEIMRGIGVLDRLMPPATIQALPAPGQNGNGHSNGNGAI